MARKKSKQAGVGNKEQSLSKSLGGGGDAGAAAAARSTQSVHTCCLLCHREFKDWGSGLANGLPGHGSKLADAVPALSQALLREAPGRKLADAVPSLSQSLLGEVPLWICQSCRKSVEEEERRAVLEQSAPVPLSHSSSCKSQNCGNGYPEQNSVDWDPSSFLSARKLSGLWNSTHSNTGAHCTHGTATHSQQAGGTAGPTCHDKRSSHEASGTKVCPYSHPASPSATSTATPLSTSAELCKTSAKHFKTMCRRPTPPGEAFHPNEQHQPSADLSVPPNSPTGLSSSQNSSLLPPSSKPTSNQHAPFTPLVPNLGAKHPGGQDKPSACKNAKLSSSMMGCNHPCNGHNTNGAAASTNVAHLTASTCRDQACKGHKLVNGSSLCQQAACEGDEMEDEDSGSERSSCASSSTNQRDGKYCDCCYCEFFGHNAPPAAPTSRNYAEIREKLRSRLTRRKEELPQRQDLDPAVTSAIDHRDVDELLHFINSTEPKRVNSAKAAKRARHKQKKKEKERALQACSEQRLSSSPQPEEVEEVEEEEEERAPDGEAGRLLEWPQLELERVNSFLTSRLEEIKNTIKDSIRASFSMYDLNLDVSDFPKKAASLEGQRLLPHLNGSATEPQQIDLDLAPLSFKNFKKSVKILQGLTSENNNSSPPPTPTTPTPTNNNTTINITPAPNDAPKSKDETKNATGNAAKAKKGKKNQRQQQEQVSQEQQVNSKPAKVTSGNQEKSSEVEKGARGGCRGAQQHGECQKTGSKKIEESKQSSKHNGNAASNGNHHSGSNTQRGKNENETRSNKLEHETDGKSNSNNVVNFQNSQQQQQSKGKNKKNKSKTEKSSSAIDDVFLPKDLDPTEMDEIDREVEYFKRFCLDSAKQTRQKVAVNWSNFSLKKMPSNAAQ
ncbi:protein FAM193B isoform X1 [Ictalurus furcatus]|uniref:protein FAM193B isoform X1 n=1 Tax=Ictalurus furcatus TaxID=66913 RepID=UPI002350C306|nr:protein FAM193B isoform X1 [Ictalurus furcatus]